MDSLKCNLAERHTTPTKTIFCVVTQNGILNVLILWIFISDVTAFYQQLLILNTKSSVGAAAMQRHDIKLCVKKLH